MIRATNTYVRSSEEAKARRRYGAREALRGQKKPTCRVCRDPLLNVRYTEGFTTCYVHDAHDPVHLEALRPVNSGLSPLFGGPRGGALEVERVRRLLEGVERKWIAGLLGVSETTVLRWERGERAISVRAVRAVEAALGETE